MPTDRNLSEIFADIKSRGWKVSNCFELNTGMWQVNARRTNDMHNGSYTTSHEFCMGSTAEEAAEGVLVDMSQDRNKIKVPPPGAALEYVTTGGRSARSRAADLDRQIEEAGI